MNQLITSCTDIAVVFIGGFAYAKLGLRLVLSVFFALATTGGVLILIIGDSSPGVMPIILSLAKGGVKVTFDICYLANSTIFPAIFAGTAFGFCNAGAKISTIISPLLAEVDPPIPMTVFVCVAGLGIFMSWLIITEEKD